MHVPRRGQNARTVGSGFWRSATRRRLVASRRPDQPAAGIPALWLVVRGLSQTGLARGGRSASPQFSPAGNLLSSWPVSGKSSSILNGAARVGRFSATGKLDR